MFMVRVDSINRTENSGQGKSSRCAGGLCLEVSGEKQECKYLIHGADGKNGKPEQVLRVKSNQRDPAAGFLKDRRRDLRTRTRVTRISAGSITAC